MSTAALLAVASGPAEFRHSPGAPRRPALIPGTPVVWRAPDVLQVGFTVAVPHAPRNARTAVRLLDGTRTLAQAAAAAQVDPVWLERCAANLARAGCFASHRRACIGVYGDGPLATRLVEVLGARYAVSRNHAAAATAVVVTSGWHASNRGACSALTARGIPHLLAGGLPGGAAVGPFVVPGAYPCQRCLDLTLAERDRQWPQVAAQLETAAHAVDPGAALWAAGLAATHVDAFVAGREPESAGRTWELVNGELRVRRWPRRPDCECADAVA